MLHDVVAWCLHSPGRLAAVGLTAAAVVVGVVLVAGTTDQPATAGQADRPSAPPTAAASSSVPPPSTAGESSPRPDETAPAGRSAAEPAAEKFLAHYLVETTPPALESWRAAVQPLVTPSLWRGLQHTDPSALPRGSVEELEVDAAGAFGAEILAHLTDDTTLALSLVWEQGGWRVADVQPADPS
ncbi:MAG: hypothetical protein GEU96_07385 [Propionibacteriales bacterium]|nr:hypothetical protein [Propionibacteriales bacterium]